VAAAAEQLRHTQLAAAAAAGELPPLPRPHH
jgi:hypothetical protein